VIQSCNEEPYRQTKIWVVNRGEPELLGVPECTKLSRAELSLQGRVFNHPDKLNICYHTLEGDVRIVLVIARRVLSIRIKERGFLLVRIRRRRTKIIEVQVCFVKSVDEQVSIIEIARCRRTARSRRVFFVEIVGWRGRRRRRRRNGLPVKILTRRVWRRG
jgi:hypothetical protein